MEEEDRVGDVWECPAQGARPPLKRIVTGVGDRATLNGKRPGTFQYGDFVNHGMGDWRHHATSQELLAQGFVKVARGICHHRSRL